MKKTLSLFILLVMAAVSFAQDPAPAKPALPPHEIHVKAGLLSVPTILVLTEQLFSTAFTGGQVRVDHISSTGALTLGYQHRLNRYFALTADGVYQKITSDVYHGNQTYTERETATFLSVMGGFKFYYLEREKIRLYMQAAAGLSEMKESGVMAGTAYTDYHQLLAFHLNPIGIQVGRRLALDLEVISVGYMGTMNIGASYRF